jgi:hypothetical protein
MNNLLNFMKEYSGLFGLLFLFVFGMFTAWRRIYGWPVERRNKHICKNCKSLWRWYPNRGFGDVPKGCETRKLPIPEGCPYILELTLLENKTLKSYFF